MEIVGPILLILLLLVGFGKIAGIDSTRVVSTYVNLLFQLLVVIGEVLAKVAIPLIKHGGEKIVYIANQYLEQHKKNNPKISEGSAKPPDFSTFNPNKPSSYEVPPASPAADQASQQQPYQESFSPPKSDDKPKNQVRQSIRRSARAGDYGLMEKPFSILEKSHWLRHMKIWKKLSLPH